MRVFVRLLAASVRRARCYPLSFMTGMLEGMAFFAVNYALLHLSVMHTGADALKAAETMRRIAYFQVFIGTFYGLFIDNITALKYYINRGDLDWLMLKPAGTQFLISFRFISFGHLFSAGCALPLIAKTFEGNPLSFLDAAVALYYLLLALAGAYALLLGTTAFAVLFTSNGNVSSLVMPVLSLGRYPRGVFSKHLGVCLLLLAPPAVLCERGVRALSGMHRAEDVLIGLAVTAGAQIVASWLFKRACAGYRSTGS